MPVPEHIERVLRLLTVGDETTLRRAMAGELPTALDARCTALVGLAALIALEADQPSYQAIIDTAHAAGVEDEEIMDTVMAIAPLVGEVRLRSALPDLATALGSEPAGL